MGTAAARLHALAAQFPVDWSQWYRGREPSHVARAIIASLVVEDVAGREIDWELVSDIKEALQRHRSELASVTDVSGALAEIDVDAQADHSHVLGIRRLASLAMRSVPQDASWANSLRQEVLAAELRANKRRRRAFDDCIESWRSAGEGPPGATADLTLMAQIGEALHARHATFDPRKMTRIADGYSKLTLRTTLDGTPVVLRADRRVEYAGSSVAYEFDVLKAAFAEGVPVPRPLELYDADPGRHDGFAVLEAVGGEPFGWVPEFRDRELCRRLGQTLARIHRVDCTSLANLRGTGKPTHVQMREDIERRVAPWRAAGCVNPVVEYAIAWLHEHEKWAEGSHALVHGDYRPQNILRDGAEITAVLDWEHAKVGNPVEDLAYVREAAESLWSWDEFLDAYIASGGIPPKEEELRYYDVYTALFVVSILDQIEHGFTGAPDESPAKIASVARHRPSAIDRIGQVGG